MFGRAGDEARHDPAVVAVPCLISLPPSRFFGWPSFSSDNNVDNTPFCIIEAEYAVIHCHHASPDPGARYISRRCESLAHFVDSRGEREAYAGTYAGKALARESHN